MALIIWRNSLRRKRGSPCLSILWTLCVWKQVKKYSPIHLTAVYVLFTRRPCWNCTLTPQVLWSEIAKNLEICGIRKVTACNSRISCGRAVSPTFFPATSSVEMLNDHQPLNLSAGLSLPPPSPLQQTVEIILSFCPSAWCSLMTGLFSNTINSLNRRSVAKKSWFILFKRVRFPQSFHDPLQLNEDDSSQ